MDAPEKIWTPANGQSIIPGGVKRWPTDVEYTRTDRANELVAAACEGLINQAVGMADGRDEARYIEDRMRDAIPADAVAALAARDARIREAALREAYVNLKTYRPHEVDGPEHDVGYTAGYVTAMSRVEALIAKDKANG